MIHPYYEILLCNQKEKNYWYVQQPGWITQELCVGWKKPIPKSYILHYSISLMFLKLQNSRNGEHINVCLRLRNRVGCGRKVSVGIKDNRWDPCGYRNVLCLDSTHVSILFVIIYYDFSRCFLFGTMENIHGFSVLFFTIACVSTSIFKKSSNKKNLS